MNDQLKTFLSGLFTLLTDLRKFGHDGGHRVSCADGQITAAERLGVFTFVQANRFRDLLINAGKYASDPFPCDENSGPCMPIVVWWDRHKAALEVKARLAKLQAQAPVNVKPKSLPRYINSAALFDSLPGYWIVEFSCGHSGILQAPSHRSPVVGHCSACESAADLSAASALMLCQDCLHVRPYCEAGHFGDYRCDCGGDFCGCNSCNDFAHGQGADFEKRQALEAANEKPEPVPAPTSRRELRLLCLLAKPQLDTAQGAYLPIHTMHRLPPRAMVKGQWSEPRYAGLYLRETQARQPSESVLARCERHRQTHALRAPARTVRAGGVIA